MSVRTLGRFVLFAAGLPLSVVWARNPSDSIEYFERADMKGKAKAVICLNARQSKNPLLFGHTALTTFFIDDENSSSSNLKSKEATWVGFWPAKFKDSIEQEDSATRKKTFLPFGSKGDFYKVFEKSEDNVKGERICHAVNAEELAQMNKFLENKRGKVWTPIYNCNDLAAEAFLKATGISFEARRPTSLGCSLPGTMANVLQRYRKTLDPKTAKQLNYTPVGSDEIAFLKASDEATLKEQSSRRNHGPRKPRL